MANSTKKRDAKTRAKTNADGHQPSGSASKQTDPVHDDLFATVVLSLYYVYVAALHGALSQLMLGPVYGSIIAADQHARVLSSSILFGFLLKSVFPHIKVPQLKYYLPLIPFYIPLLQKILFKYSGALGATAGPLVTEIVSLLPFLFLSALCAAEELSAIQIFRDRPYLFLIPGVAAYMAITVSEPIFADYITSFGSMSRFLTRVWIYIGSSSLGLAQSTPSLAITALPAIWYNLQYNPHLQWDRTTRYLEKELEPLKWTLLDRRESTTGYISVLQNEDPYYRVIRCDHSILGGEWLLNDELRAEGVTGTEPIYGVFALLEAVRLVETVDKGKQDHEKQALSIGLGIGTAPKAFAAHGIDTTIVELDPAVYDFAVKYFELPKNITAHIQDAASWTANKSLEASYRNKYDFILHDVFTGGAEPLVLFTESFFKNLRNLLSIDGVIAINYAGDVKEQPAKQVLHTIDSAFGGRCRIFRDLLPEGDENADSNRFANMVVFCLHPHSKLPNDRPIFRKATEADFLSSHLRQQHLQPQSAHELQFPTPQDMESERIKILKDQDVSSFRYGQLASAKRHWKIMRAVLPAAVWVNW